MTFTDTQKSIAAAVGGYKYFIPRSEAAQQLAEAKQETKKTVEQLRAELLLMRVKELAEKEAKEGLTPSEKVERDLNLKQVEAIQAEAVKK